MKAKDLIARIELINNYLTFMQTQNNISVPKMTDSKLKDIVAKNLPQNNQIKLSESGLSPTASLAGVQQKLMVFEINNQRKAGNNRKPNSPKKDTQHNNKKNHGSTGNRKKFRNECRKHGGTRMGRMQVESREQKKVN